MSIIVSDLSFHYPNCGEVFNHLSLAVEKQQKVSIVGNNGVGKSTLLRIMAGELQPVGGSVMPAGTPYYIPQHTGLLGISVAQALGIEAKLAALNAIAVGSVDERDYDTLGDDWEVEARCAAALDYWQLRDVTPHTLVDSLSGGEKMKVLLAGMLLHMPAVILMDEPTNHLDTFARELLYRYIANSTATIVVVSHDVTLLEQLQITFELSAHGMKTYGGSYSFYRAQKQIEDNALNQTINNEQKSIRLALRKEQQVKERQEKRLIKGQKSKGEVPRIFRKTLTNSSENTAARLRGAHTEIIAESRTKLAQLKQQRGAFKELKIDFDNASMHSGKLLIEALAINYAYRQGAMLWPQPIDMAIYSGERIHICGDNGAGKSTLTQLLTGQLMPLEGQIRRTDFSYIYLDQNYIQVDVGMTVVELAQQYNTQNLPEHEIKLRLDRALFPAYTWDKCCRNLSGGEKMRLYLCCLMIRNETPDMIVLDEPTNNLDIASLEILTSTIRNYMGSLLVISHDAYFVDRIGVTGEVMLSLT